MSERSQYELLDFGNGRRLERFGAVVVDRPCVAAASHEPAHPEAWETADVRFRGQTEGQEEGEWRMVRDLPDPWLVEARHFKLKLKPSKSGQIGVFPEQTANWTWLYLRVRGAGRPLKVLNLFGYTGGSTLAAAAAGARVAHVDASKSAVKRARDNAELSQLGEAPIRWLVEDATTFVDRELRRGAGYDAIVLDPPSYGHGPNGEAWNIDALDDLLAKCAKLTAGRLALVMLTCHSAGYDPRRLKDMLSTHFSVDRVESHELSLRDSQWRRLQAGALARFAVQTVETAEAEATTPNETVEDAPAGGPTVE